MIHILITPSRLKPASACDSPGQPHLLRSSFSPSASTFSSFSRNKLTPPVLSIFFSTFFIIEGQNKDQQYVLGKEPAPPSVSTRKTSHVRTLANTLHLSRRILHWRLQKKRANCRTVVCGNALVRICSVYVCCPRVKRVHLLHVYVYILLVLPIFSVRSQ